MRIGGGCMATSLEREREEQGRWRLRPGNAGIRWFDPLIANEFMTPAHARQSQSRLLGAITGYASQRVPYYREIYGALGLKPGRPLDLDMLPGLPVLSREQVLARTADLRTRQLPPGQRCTGFLITSGTTGTPVKVYDTSVSGRAFVTGKQREMRWFRYDPSGCIGWLRPAKDFLSSVQRTQKDGYVLAHKDRWPIVGELFETGPFAGFGRARYSEAKGSSIDAQVRWLETTPVNYLTGQASDLEQLALGFQNRPPLKHLKSILSISQQLTDEMRERIEQTFGVPVQQNYGLNEFGLVAIRCPEGRRYHVNIENYVVEVVDGDGNPSPPGEPGRLLISTLSNYEMPLFRYDSGDGAVFAADPCPCGRTLPALTAIFGRYRRLAALPEGTWQLFKSFQRALNETPADLMAPVREYQLHQYKDGRFELRLVAAKTLASGLRAHFEAAWREFAQPGTPLAVITVDSLQRPPSGKFENFTSEFMPEPAHAADQAPVEHTA